MRAPLPGPGGADTRWVATRVRSTAWRGLRLPSAKTSLQLRVWVTPRPVHLPPRLPPRRPAPHWLGHPNRKSKVPENLVPTRATRGQQPAQFALGSWLRLFSFFKTVVKCTQREMAASVAGHQRPVAGSGRPGAVCPAGVPSPSGPAAHGADSLCTQSD